MSGSLRTLEQLGDRRILLTERGAAFGYNQLVADITSIPMMQELGHPVFFAADVGGARAQEYVPLLLRAAIAAGTNGIVLDTHPDPARALCDGARQYPLQAMEDLMTEARDLGELIRGAGARMSGRIDPELLSILVCPKCKGDLDVTQGPEGEEESLGLRGLRAVLSCRRRDSRHAARGGAAAAGSGRERMKR